MFRFRLQRVLELKEEREQETAARLAEARSAASEAREKARALQEIRSESGDVLSRVQFEGVPAGELRNVSDVLESLDRKIEEASNLSDAADETVQGLVEELATAFKERRVLDLLRLRRHGEWKAVEASEDRQAMDGVALARFARRDTTHRTGS